MNHLLMKQQRAGSSQRKNSKCVRMNEMKSCGIIAEYNPFHHGHAYQIEQARKQSQADVMIIAMSGNFTQRGEPAIFDKWERAKVALENGADLVVEQSVLGSVQSSDLFAEAGIHLLDALGCDSFSFGAETADGERLIQLADQLIQQEAAINHVFQSVRNDGRTYASQMTDAIQAVLGSSSLPETFWKANSQLGLAYLKANLRATRPMEAYLVERMGAGHQGELDRQQQFASGTAIRQLIHSRKFAEAKQWMPLKDESSIAHSPAASWTHFWPLLRYRLLLLSPEELRLIYQMEEGIEHRLKKYAAQADSFDLFINLVKNKRWTWVRLQRLAVYVLLDIRKEMVASYFSQPPLIRVLGFTEKGRRHLKAIKKTTNSLILTNVSQKNHSYYEKEIQADQIYQFGLELKQSEQNYTRAPIVIKS